MSVLLNAMSLMLLLLLTVSMVTGALFDDSCMIDDSLPSIESLSLSTSESSYAPGQTLTVRLLSTSGVTDVDELILAGLSASASATVVGKFHSALPGGVQQACNGSTVTHNNTSVRTLELVWNAPSTSGVGEIRFVANVAINGSKFAVSSGVVRELTGDIIDTSSCGRTKLCMRDPAGCDGASCDWLMTSRDVGVAYDIELSATVTQTSAWVAFGLSHDEKMGYDSCVDCIHDASTNNIIIQLSWSGRGIDNHAVHGREHLLVESSLSGSYVDGRITCRFRRLKYPLLNDDQSYPLVNDTAYFVLLARGPSMAGILMLFAWMLFASFAILMPRYCKPAWPGQTLLGKQIWFRIHQSCMLTTFALTSIGFIVVFVAVKRYSRLVAPTDGHPPCGIIVMALCFVNPIMAFFRPEPGAKRRPIFNCLHFIVGELAHIFAAVTMVLAMYMVLPDLQRYVWCRAVMFVYICVHALVEITLAIHKHRRTIARSLPAVHSGQWDVPMNAVGSDAVPIDTNLASENDSGSRFITVVLILHLTAVVAIAVALSVQIGIS